MLVVFEKPLGTARSRFEGWEVILGTVSFPWLRRTPKGEQCLPYLLRSLLPIHTGYWSEPMVSDNDKICSPLLLFKTVALVTSGEAYFNEKAEVTFLSFKNQDIGVARTWALSFKHRNPGGFWA